MSGWDFPYEMKREGRYIQKLKFLFLVNFSQKLTRLGIVYDSIRVQSPSERRKKLCKDPRLTEY